VFADFFLFKDLRGLGLRDSELNTTADQYLAQLGLAGKVSISEGGFSTIALSQGQRKRLALVAAYLEDRPIYVFDEWAAEQDPTFKKFFYTELLPGLKARGKAVVVISHDERYFSLADQTIKLEDGRLVSEATAAFMERLTGSVAEG
jgi:putative ATP-binding cassette transporter